MFGSSVAMLALYVAVWVVVAVPAGICLILCQRKTRLSGFTWLFVSVVVWPVLARALSLGISVSAPAIMASRGWTVSVYGAVVAAISLAEAVVGGILLFVSCLILYRQLPAVDRTGGTTLPAAPYGIQPSSRVPPLP